MNHDLKNLANWLKANKTELALFISPKKQLDSDLKMKLNGKKLYETGLVKYLGIQNDKSLTRKQQQIDHMAIKPTKANAMLSKLRNVLDKKSLKSANYAIFESHLC